MKTNNAHRRSRALATTLAIFSLFALLGACEDPLTAVAAESVRLAGLPEYTLTMLAPSDGSASPAAGTYKIKDGEPMAISATANGGYTFMGWDQTGGTGTVTFASETSPNTTVSVTGGDATIKAIIDDTSYTITVAAGTGGTVSLGSLSVNQGVPSDPVTATPNAGYSFSGWSVTAGLASGITFNPSASSASVTMTANAGDATVRASFVDSQAPSGTVAIQNKILVDGTNYNKDLNRIVTVNLTYTDNSGTVSFMKLSSATFLPGTTTGWVATGLSTTFTFPSDGAKTLYVRFKDAAGNESGLITDTTYIDITPPVPSRYQVELISNPGTYPDYVSTYNTNLQLNYLASDAGSGVQKVYFSRTSTRPATAQVQSYPTVPVPYAWSIADTYYSQNYYNVYFWFEDKLGNISAPYIDPIKYDDKYEGNYGNSTIDAVSGATIIMDGTPTGGAYGTQYRLYTFYEPDWLYGYLVDTDYYKWGFYPLNSSSTYPVEIILYVNNGASSYAQMPQVTFYNHNRTVIPYTYTYPYLNNAQVRYTLEMPYIDTAQEYYFYMRIQKAAETAPYALRPNYDIYWTFSEDEGM